MDFRFRGRPVVQGLIGLAVTAPILYAVTLIAQTVVLVVSGSSPNPLAHQSLQTLHDNPGSVVSWVLVGTAVLGAPFVEELMFRVFLQSALLRLLGRTWPSILVTSALFALVHLGGGVRPSEAYALAPLFILSVAMGVVYERTRSALAPITMHMAFNALNVALTSTM